MIGRGSKGGGADGVRDDMFLSMGFAPELVREARRLGGMNDDQVSGDALVLEPTPSIRVISHAAPPPHTFPFHCSTPALRRSCLSFWRRSP